jgi:hypothetical protein
MNRAVRVFPGSIGFPFLAGLCVPGLLVISAVYATSEAGLGIIKSSLGRLGMRSILEIIKKRTTYLTKPVSEVIH